MPHPSTKFYDMENLMAHGKKWYTRELAARRCEYLEILDRDGNRIQIEVFDKES